MWRPRQDAADDLHVQLPSLPALAAYAAKPTTQSAFSPALAATKPITAISSAAPASQVAAWQHEALLWQRKSGQGRFDAPAAPMSLLCSSAMQMRHTTRPPYHVQPPSAAHSCGRPQVGDSHRGQHGQPNMRFRGHQPHCGHHLGLRCRHLSAKRHIPVSAATASPAC